MAVASALRLNALEAEFCPGYAGDVREGVENLSDVLAGGRDPPGVVEAGLAEGAGVLFGEGGAEPGQ